MIIGSHDESTNGVNEEIRRRHRRERGAPGQAPARLHRPHASSDSPALLIHAVRRFIVQPDDHARFATSPFLRGSSFESTRCSDEPRRATTSTETLALAAYNAGPDRVRKWLDDGPPPTPETAGDWPRFPETRAFVRRVLDYEARWRAESAAVPAR